MIAYHSWHPIYIWSILPNKVIINGYNLQTFEPKQPHYSQLCQECWCNLRFKSVWKTSDRGARDYEEGLVCCRGGENWKRLPMNVDYPTKGETGGGRWVGGWDLRFANSTRLSSSGRCLCLPWVSSLLLRHRIASTGKNQFEAPAIQHSLMFCR